MKTENSESKSLWKKASVANLVRYEPSGIYFARAKVRGKLIRKSLDTNVLTVAKLRLADVLDTEQKAVAPSQTKIVGKMTFADALAIFKERQKLATDIKDSTKAYNARAAFDLLKTWSGLEQMDVKRITKFDCLEWRAKFGKMYSPTVADKPRCFAQGESQRRLVIRFVIRQSRVARYARAVFDFQQKRFIPFAV